MVLDQSHQSMQQEIHPILSQLLTQSSDRALMLLSSAFSSSCSAPPLPARPFSALMRVAGGGDEEAMRSSSIPDRILLDSMSAIEGQRPGER